MNARRIAMWSGPRNISTALMRSWGSRDDTWVTDEPFYAHYLRQTGIDHPGREEIVEEYPDDWSCVAEWLTGPVPKGKTIWYQKHMTHHILEGMIGDWLGELSHAFLIRDPALVIASFTRVIAEPTIVDIGLPRQVELFEEIEKRTGRTPPVVDSDDLLRDPASMLERLCEALEVRFDEAMLSWESGPRPTDGLWSRHWYASVERSTGFLPWSDRKIVLDGTMRELEEECRPYYEKLAAHKIG